MGVSHGNRSVVLQVNVDGIAVYEENMTLISEHSFTTIKSYAASVKRHTFAFKQQLVPGGEEIVHEFYLEHSRLLHDYVTKYVPRGLARLSLRGRANAPRRALAVPTYRCLRADTSASCSSTSKKSNTRSACATKPSPCRRSAMPPLPPHIRCPSLPRPAAAARAL